jgi:hypothetical protein
MAVNQNILAETLLGVADRLSKVESSVANLEVSLPRWMDASFTRLEASLAIRIDAAMEQTRDWLRASGDETRALRDQLADTTRDQTAAHASLARDHAALRAAFEAHRDDATVHRVPRSRRSRGSSARPRRR